MLKSRVPRKVLSAERERKYEDSGEYCVAWTGRRDFWWGKS